MARRETRAQIARKVESLFLEQEEKVKQAFLDAIDSIVSQIVLERVLYFLEAGEITKAIEALQIDKRYFAPFVTAVLDAYQAGGDSLMPEIGSSIPFDAHDDRLESAARGLASDLVDHAVSTALATAAIVLATSRPKRVLLGVLVGTKHPIAKKRVGGVLWLSQPFNEWVNAARAELGSADAGALSNYLSRKQRDKRFDRFVKDALRDGKRMPSTIVSKAITAYATNLLNLRAKAFGESGAITAINMGRDHAAKQAYEHSGKIDPDAPIWISERDNRVRNSHVYLDGQRRDQDGYFRSLKGVLIRYPKDPLAPLYETASCRCHLQYGKVGNQKYPADFATRRTELLQQIDG